MKASIWLQFYSTADSNGSSYNKEIPWNISVLYTIWKGVKEKLCQMENWSRHVKLNLFNIDLCYHKKPYVITYPCHTLS